jgi:hypothetical protein
MFALNINQEWRGGGMRTGVAINVESSHAD